MLSLGAEVRNLRKGFCCLALFLPVAAPCPAALIYGIPSCPVFPIQAEHGSSSQRFFRLSA